MPNRDGTVLNGSQCPLCESVARPFARAHGRRYLDCDVCGLIHAHPADRLDPAAERARYLTHENDPADPGYRAFLARLADPLKERLPPGASGLDYGAGPGPTLSVMLEEAGFPMEVWDPFFAPDPGVLGRTYDFITCTETAEHFFRPGDELARLASLLRAGGWLGLMTRRFPEGGAREEDGAFEDWWYVRDPTHVSFYRWRTMEWIAARFGWSLEPVGPTVVLFRSGAGRRSDEPRSGERHGAG